ncbi:MAG: hypothetical protein M0006_02530 [Magnetospirillum sp.]|nr:hypothetical protein [Magnetospirillum sp.]
MHSNAAMEALLDRMPAEVADSLTPEQRAALYDAISSPTWRCNPVDVRLSVPMPGTGRRCFVTIVAGWERRGAERIRRERLIYRLGTAGNLVFLLGMGVGMLAVAAVLAAGARFLGL